jgi:hypothetical protein
MYCICQMEEQYQNLAGWGDDARLSADSHLVALEEKLKPVSMFRHLVDGAYTLYCSIDKVVGLRGLEDSGPLVIVITCVVVLRMGYRPSGDRKTS